jgi:GTP1/Obg family GTP-binding protein
VEAVMVVARNLAPTDLMDHMWEALADLARQVELYKEQLVEVANTKNDYAELYAKTYLEIKASADKMTVGEIDARVTDRVKDMKRRADIAEALMKATREKMDLDKEQIGVAQSVLAFSRAELERTLTTNPVEPVWRGT